MSERYGRKYFSISEIKAALQCGAQHHFRYVRRIRKPTPLDLVRGSAYDAALRVLYEGRLNGQERSLEEAQAAADAYFDQAVAEEEIDWGGAEPARALDEVRALVRKAVQLYYEQIWPDIRPAAFQDRFEIEFEDVDWTFVGYIDLVTVEAEVWDDKLYTRTPTQDAVDQDLQLTAYALGHQLKYGRLPTRLGIQAVVLTKTPKVVRIPTQRTQEDVDWFLGLLGETVRMIEAGIVVPRPGGWYCSPTQCQYWAECRAMFGGRATA